MKYEIPIDKLIFLLIPFFNREFVQQFSFNLVILTYGMFI